MQVSKCALNCRLGECPPVSGQAGADHASARGCRYDKILLVSPWDCEIESRAISSDKLKGE